MKKYLPTLVMQIIIIIIFSSFATAVEINLFENKICNNTISDNLQEIELEQTNNQFLERGYVLFSQRPYLPTECWSFFISANDAELLCQEDFNNLKDPINDVYWWGVTLINDQGWVLGSPIGMEFEIIFYQDNNGTPGNIEKTLSNITPTYIDTGLIYADLYKLYYFQTDISPELSLINGWISIQSTYSPNNSWFLWAGSPEGNFNALQNGTNVLDNLAFNLTTDTPPPAPIICCEGNLLWENVNSGAMLNATFQISNCGEVGSLLNWEVDTIPLWGNWTFTPDSGTELAEGDNVTITVGVVAPLEKKKTFTGKIKLINSDNTSDFCEIDVSLTTPRARTGFTLIQWILQKYPNIFLIYRKILT